MASLSVTPVGPATLGGLSALRPLPVPGGQTPGQTQGLPAFSTQDLAQALFQRTLQSATLFPVAEPALGSASLLQDTTAALLASMTTTPATSATTNPAAVQATDTTTSTAPSPTPPSTALGDLPATQDSFATSSSTDFALQTALRFGAGVSALATPALADAGQGAGLVRDAASVQRLGSLQPRAGSPGPEAFAQPQTTTQRILRSYELAAAIPSIQGTSALDLLV